MEQCAVVVVVVSEEFWLANLQSATCCMVGFALSAWVFLFSGLYRSADH